MNVFSFSSSPMQNCSYRTVQLFVIDGEKLLLVHEKGDEEVENVKSNKGVKPPGSGLPGGGIDESKSEEYILSRLLRSLLPVYRIDENLFRGMTFNQDIEPKLFLTAVTEGIEETGLLICPLRVLFEEQNSRDHKVVVALGAVLGGSIQQRSIETNGCNWFNIQNLPWDTYRSHVKRIIKALKVLGRDDMALRVTIEEKPKNAMTQEEM